MKNTYIRGVQNIDGGQQGLNEGKECEYENCSRVLIQLTFCFDIYYTLVDQLIRTAGLLSAQCLVLMAWNLGARDLSSSLESLDSTCIAR